MMKHAKRVRYPAQAGTFYSASASSLKKEIEECFLNPTLGPGKLPKVVERGPRKIVALICPHAGYMYSGPIASHGYFKLSLDGRPDSFIILGPNHTGMGTPIAMFDEGIWEMPFGPVEIDSELSSLIYRKSEIIDINYEAHMHEHSIEVQLPFLQYLYGTKFKFVPICMLLQELETSRMVGKAIAECIRGKNVVIIASTDFTHYEPHKKAKEKDRVAIDAILKLDEEALQSSIQKMNITMCGPGPVIASIVAAKELGATKAELLSYKTSGDVTHDYEAVVGYASISISYE